MQYLFFYLFFAEGSTFDACSCLAFVLCRQCEHVVILVLIFLVFVCSVYRCVSALFCHSAPVCNVTQCSTPPLALCVSSSGVCYDVNATCPSNGLISSGSNDYGSYQCFYPYATGSFCWTTRSIGGVCDSAGNCIGMQSISFELSPRRTYACARASIHSLARYSVAVSSFVYSQICACIFIRLCLCV